MDLIRTALGLELADGTVIADSVGQTPCVFLAGLHRAERTIADRLMRLANGTRLPWLGISGRDHPGHDAALHHCCSEICSIPASLGARSWSC
jgi:hypothetical protein